MPAITIRVLCPGYLSAKSHDIFQGTIAVRLSSQGYGVHIDLIRDRPNEEIILNGKEIKPGIIMLRSLV